MKRNEFREAIDKLFDSEISVLPRFQNMPEGQREEFRGKFLEYMILDLGSSFVHSEDVSEKLQIAKFLADYSGRKPKVDQQITIIENPYEEMSVEELEQEERKLINGTE
jgi:hypothetical protein